MSALPRLGHCQRCGDHRHMFSHRSRRDQLVRALCVSCYSVATLIEETGHTVDFHRPDTAGHISGPDLDEAAR